METVTTVLLWLLGVVFLLAGAMKALAPEDRLRAQSNMGWVEREGIGRARIAGWAELAAGAAFLLAVLNVIPNVLAGLAAVGIIVIMGLATVTVHRPHDEPIVPTIVLGVLAAVLAVGAFAT